MTTRSERDWLRVRAHLREHRHALGVAAAALYPDLPRVAGTPLLTRPQWTPAAPVPLEAVEVVPDDRAVRVPTAPAALRPRRADGTRYPSYSAAKAALDAPAVFENRRTWRLLDADLAGPAPRLVVGPGRYFDGADTGEAAAHEYTAGGHAFRARLGDPTRRPTNVAISALTLRRGRATYWLHRRDPAAVGHAGGLAHVLPVGVFQDDPSPWRFLRREYAEELLGVPEPAAPVDPAGMTPWCLGLGVDPLTLATDLLVAVVVDDDRFTDVVAANAEGEVVPDVPFGPVPPEPMQAAGAAVLALAWAHRDALLA